MSTSGRVCLRRYLGSGPQLPLSARSVLWAFHSLCDRDGVVCHERLRVGCGLDLQTWAMTVDWLVASGLLCRLGGSLQATPPLIEGAA